MQKNITVRTFRVFSVEFTAIQLKVRFFGIVTMGFWQPTSPDVCVIEDMLGVIQISFLIFLAVFNSER